ncbi:MAG: Maleylacetoacetate isomerase (EC @ Glutathione S-transferase, zeta (EC [uncultured Paraburkholderia sp.]|uniref:maleylacetoacetate isomerase n=1 Tax=uncultured Paraburkholderia sp. TaxID=1822466 RepID=UPI002592EA57|nr:maleylacetoacetate isomerase [uncultured Paraburkholderia sp.]CAH2904330.1 MAG: Maleylacetoacetate isomerase (EC @ Glutathione S-transferase, zeta (EC [uncultured Paraburkholderia sp.]CAH2943179.1 MAG: Maleylacetoacetate isomerase (EC @ Glutathione S-transferase, zeta (EC [uncultured Paraburkholderia sp.]
MRLLNYFRSSASYRVWIACNLKGLPYEYVAIHLNRNGGEQFGPEFSELNPQQLVPLLQDGGPLIAQSIAILEYLEERYPDVPLLPRDIMARAHVRQIAQYIACDVHPLNNLRVLKFLTGRLHLSEDQKNAWIVHWLETGLSTIENQLNQSSTRGAFCMGDTPTIADCCLVPQMFSARRFGIDIERYPTLFAIEKNCNEMAAFQLAQPTLQPDAE